jgi:crotonobetainyl-CoA:carnitine CoA-transferase CaiB-like acyl-CoA transferase
VRVLDLTRLVPGDLASRKLADLGADVLKIENPDGGDYLRSLPPRVGDTGVHHWNLNRGKRSVVLDLNSEQDKKTLLSLAAVADVLLEVSVPGKYSAMGIDFTELRRKYPSLVICSISAFGQNGPLATLPAHGMNLDALAGCMHSKTVGDRAVIDLDLSTSLASELGALNAALAVSAAVLCARGGGGGAWIDISCWDSAVEIQRATLVRVAAGVPADQESVLDAVLYSLYEASDGRLVLFCAIEKKFWERFCTEVGRPDLIARWSGPTGGVDYRTGDRFLREELKRIFLTSDSETWFERFLTWRIPGSLVMNGKLLPHFSHTTARALWRTRPGESLPTIGDPIRWMDDGTRAGMDATRSPELGEHTATALRDWLGEAE